MKSTTPTVAPKQLKKKSGGSAKSGEEPKPKPAASKEVVEDFPRGGGSSINPFEYRALRDEGVEQLFKEERGEAIPDGEIIDVADITAKSTKPVKADKASKSGNDEKKTKPARKGDAVKAKGGAEDVILADSSAITKHVEVLTFKKLSAGMVLLGVVKDIHDFDVDVSLPGGLTGSIQINDLSDEFSARIEQELNAEDSEAPTNDPLPTLSQIFKIGQLISCAVKALDTTGSRHRVHLTLNPKIIHASLTAAQLSTNQILSGCISSVQDHGYIVSFGVDASLHGFLPKKHAQVDEAFPLTVGLPVTCAVLSVDQNRRVATLSMNLAAAQSTKSQEKVNHTIDTILPGLTVSVRVTKLAKNGLFVKVLGEFPATVDYFHLQENFAGLTPEFIQKYSQKHKFEGRILFVNRTEKHIGVSLKPALVENSLSLFKDIAFGTRYEKAIITYGDVLTGVQLTVGDEKLPAFAHISRLDDTRVEKLGKKYANGTVHPCRVVGVDLLDQMLSVSLQPSVLEAVYLQVADLVPGSVVDGEVLSINTFGILIRITDHIRGLCPLIHAADVPTKAPEKMFAVGKKVKCRVLSVDPKANKVVLTMKKSLVQSTLPPLLAYSDAAHNVVTWGVVTAIRTYGVIVSFYNNVHGLISTAELQNPDPHAKQQTIKMTLGQLVKVRVASPHIKDGRLKLSLNLEPEAVRTATVHSSETLQAFAALSVGALVDAVVTNASKDRLHVMILDHNVPAVISAAHLSDHTSHYQPLYDAWKAVGTKLTGLIVLEKGKDGVHVTLSRKPSLVAAWGNKKNVPSSVADLQVDTVLTGYVRSVVAYGCFVGFPNSLSGLVPVAEMSERFVADTKTAVTDGQSVVAKVIWIDEVEGHFKLSMKDPACADAKNAASFVTSYFEEQALLFPSQSFSEQHVELNSVHAGVVESIQEFGVILTLDGTSARGFATVEQSKSRNCSVGDKLKARILDINVEKSVVDVSLLDDLTATAVKKDVDLYAGLRAAATNKKAVEARVELIKEDYLVVSIPGTPRVVGYVAAKDLNDRRTPFPRFRAGQSIHTHIVNLPAKPTKKTKHSTGGLARLLLTFVPGSVPTGVKTKDSKKSAASDLAVGDDVKVGSRVKGKVLSCKDSQINVIIQGKVHGRVHITELDPSDFAGSPGSGLSKYKVGDSIEAKVTGFYDTKTHTYLAITRQELGTRTMVELTTKAADLALGNGQLAHTRLTFETVKVGAVVPGFIQEVHDEFMWVFLSPTVRGRVLKINVSNEMAILKKFKAHFRVGQRVDCHVISVDSQRCQIDLALYDNNPTVPGALVAGRVVKVVPNKFLMLTLGHPGTVGFVDLTDVSDEYEEDGLAKFEVGTILRACVLSAETKTKVVETVHDDDEDESTAADATTVNDDASKTVNRVRVRLSLRASRCHPEQHKPVVDPEVHSISDVKPDSLIRGFVTQTSDKGCFVHLGSEISGRVLIKDLSDDFIRDWKAMFPVGKLVKGRVLAIDAENKHVSLSLKTSAVDPVAYQARLTYDSVIVGSKFAGKVKRVEKYGVFVTLDNSNLSGLVHISEVSKDFIADLTTRYQPGDAVLVVLLSKVEDKKQLKFGMKAEYFDPSDVPVNASKDVVVENTKKARKAVELEDDDMTVAEPVAAAKKAKTKAGSVPAPVLSPQADAGVENEEDADAVPVQALTSTSTSKDRLHVRAGFGFSDTPSTAATAAAGDSATSNKKRKADAEPVDSSDDELNAESDLDEDSDDDNAATGTSKQRSKRAKRAARLAEERELAAKEQALLSEGNRAPGSADEFERLVLAKPQSSYVWIKYMAFYLAVADVDKARAVAEKALKTINFREEQERLNVWVALLNLENSYGSDASLNQVFERAKVACDPKEVYLQLVSIYERSKKSRQADELYQVMCKKFRESKRVWIQYGMFKLSENQFEACRQILQKSLKSLPKRKHIDTIAKFAQLEFKHGDAERGRTMFESILSNYPKRVDLWSIYLDMEIKAADKEIIRRLFDRVTHLNMSTKKMKFFFKKYLDFEKEHGDETTVDHVKQLAREYVESKMTD